MVSLHLAPSVIKIYCKFEKHFRTNLDKRWPSIENIVVNITLSCILFEIPLTRAYNTFHEWPTMNESCMLEQKIQPLYTPLFFDEVKI